jgi:transposase InsO family protein
VADHQKIPGTFLPPSPEPTPDPPETISSSSLVKLEDISSDASDSSSSSLDSSSTFQIAQDLLPGSSNQFTISSDSSNPLSSLKLCSEKLNDSNFSAWRYDIRNALAFYNLDGFIKEHTPELKARPDYNAKLKQVTTYIRLHLGREDSTRFVDDLDVYDPKALWDSIVEYHAAKSVENAANVMERLHDIVFVEGKMQQCINSFRQTFNLMIEVSTSKFDKKTLEAVWVFFVLKRLPPAFSMFRTLQFASFKSDAAEVTMSKFLTELETELRRQQESTAQLAATALAVQQATNSSAPTSGEKAPGEKKRRPFCSNGVHNPECTGHSKAECNQLNPARALAWHQAEIDKLQAASGNKALLSVNSGVADSIVFDSGASGHYLKRREYFTTFLPIKSSVYGANGAAIPILGTGSAVIHTSVGLIKIDEAFYAPDLSNSLIPLTYYVRRGYSVTPSQDGLSFRCHRPGHTLCVGSTAEEVLIIDLDSHKALAVKSHSQSALDLRRALGHPSLPYLKKAYPDRSFDSVACSECDTAKMHRQPFSGSFPIATKVLECLHMDLCGPITPASRGGNRYFLKIINGYSKFRFIFPLQRKSDSFAIFRSFITKAETATGQRLISVVSDNGGEFVNTHFCDLFASKGVQHHTTAPYTPQQNPFAERGNRTTVERTRAMLSTASLPLSWWGEAVTTLVYLENRSPNSSINFRSPYELWHGTPPDLSHLVPFGCRAVAYLEKDKCHSKFSPSGVKTIFLGYDEHHHTYKLWVPSTRNILVSHHVKFFPSIFPFLTSSSPSPHSIDSSSLFDFTTSVEPVLESPLCTPASPPLSPLESATPLPAPSPPVSPTPEPLTPSDHLIPTTTPQGLRPCTRL